jgi:hypothetical protein
MHVARANQFMGGFKLKGEGVYRLLAKPFLSKPSSHLSVGRASSDCFHNRKLHAVWTQRFQAWTVQSNIKISQNNRKHLFLLARTPTPFFFPKQPKTGTQQRCSAESSAT